MLTSTDKLNVKCAWEALRRRGSIQELFKYIWQIGIPFKISFSCGGFGRIEFPLDKC
ncbi:hypothetical protein R3W88_014933 [Solanum pinnatisectum]|uniref:Uncharacterized protein n=1 Tax=Solanum pinnatisectum TaxID=50273 RepID=A0AAV9KVE2_9SOLN|nr:hypothetical protein R3W88_014933 [Solanum pinnatisectum]